MKKIMFGLLMGLFLISLVYASDNQVVFPCGGDDETSFLCAFGDSQTSFFISEDAVLDGITGAIISEPVKKQLNIFIWLIPLIFIFMISLICILLVTRKKENN